MVIVSTHVSKGEHYFIEQIKILYRDKNLIVRNADDIYTVQGHLDVQGRYNKATSRYELSYID